METLATIEYDPAMSVADDDTLLDVAAMKARCLDLDLSQQAAADRAGLPGGRQQWYTIESGRHTGITLKLLGRIAAALDVPPAALLLNTPPVKAGRKATGKGKSGKGDKGA